MPSLQYSYNYEFIQLTETVVKAGLSSYNVREWLLIYTTSLF